MGATDLMSYYRRDICLLVSLLIFFVTADKRKKLPLKAVLSVAVYLLVSGLLWCADYYVPDTIKYSSFLFLNITSVIYFLNCVCMLLVPMFIFRTSVTEYFTRLLAYTTYTQLKGILMMAFDTPISLLTEMGGGSDWISNLITLAINVVIDIIILVAVTVRWHPGDKYIMSNTSVTAISYGAMCFLLYWLNILGYYVLYSVEGFVGYFGFFIIASVCLFIILMVYSIRNANMQSQKEQLMEQLMHERESQYALSRENVELINRKCHDLKHQIQALKSVSDNEREGYISELEQSIMIYGSIASTGNEALDTILSEKNLYCSGHDIKFTAVINSAPLSVLSTMDIYSLFGNAIDNAIEAVEKIEDKEYRIISLNISYEQSMICIKLTNYSFEAPQFKGSSLVSSKKEDKGYHGFGVKSIRETARKYGGETNISYEDNIFTLFVAIPASEESLPESPRNSA